MSQSDIKKRVLANIVETRLTEARLATPGYLDVRPSLDDDFDVEVRISPFNAGTADAIKALVPEARLVIREGGAWTRSTVAPNG